MGNTIENEHVPVALTALVSPRFYRTNMQNPEAISSGRYRMTKLDASLLENNVVNEESNDESSSSS